MNLYYSNAVKIKAVSLAVIGAYLALIVGIETRTPQGESKRADRPLSSQEEQARSERWAIEHHHAVEVRP